MKTMIKITKISSIFSVRQRISFRVDFYVRQQLRLILSRTVSESILANSVKL